MAVVSSSHGWFDPNSGLSCAKFGLEDMDLEISELKRMFETLDENQDGLICAVDLRRFMGRLGLDISEEEAVSMVSMVSMFPCTTDSAAGEKRADNEEDETLLEAFRLFDKNNDGFISCQELQAVLLALGLPEGKSLKSCQLMIEGVDADGSGEVDIKEFKQMMLSTNSPRRIHPM